MRKVKGDILGTNERKLEGFDISVLRYGADHFINSSRQQFYAQSYNIQTFIKHKTICKVVNLMKSKSAMIYNKVHENAHLTADDAKVTFFY